MSQGLILLVEDNVINAKVLRIAFELEGLEVMVAQDAEEARQILAKQLPNFILLDLQLPGMSGLEFARLLKMDPRIGKIPLAAITAFAMMIDEKMAMEAGCDAYFVKPFSPMKLIKFIKNKIVVVHGVQ